MEVTIATLNCATRQQPMDEIASILLKATVTPDIIAVGVQEVAPVNDTLLGTGANYRHPIYKGIESALQQKFPNKTFRLAGEEWIGGIGVLVYSPLKCSALVASTSFGSFWSSLKGAVAVQLTTGGATYTFVSTHLPAHQGKPYIDMRNQAYKILANGLRFGDKSIYDSNHLFVFGDLNYRASIQRDDTESLLTDFNFDRNDELTVEKDKGNILWGLIEAPIQFEPTFKYYIGTQEFNHKRSPSWTDRILYSDASATVRNYSSVQEYTSTDHRPVYLTLLVQPGAVVPRVEVPVVSAVPKGATAVVDRTLGSGIFLATTKIGWGIIGLLIIGLFFIL